MNRPWMSPGRIGPVLLLAVLLSFTIGSVAAEGELSPLWNYPTGSEIRAVAVSNDGLFFVTGSSDHKVNYFTRDGKLAWNFLTDDIVNSVAISANGQYIIAGSVDGKIYFFSRDGTLLWKSAATDSVNSVAVSGDGRFAVAGSSDKTILAFAQDGSVLWKFTTGGQVNSVAISADGKYVIAGAGDRNVYYFSIDGTALWSFATGADHVNKVSSSSDGQIIAAASDDNKIYYLTGKGRLVWSYDIGSLISDSTLSENGQYILVGTLDQQIYLLNRDGKLTWNFAAGNIVKSVAISDDGVYLIAGTQGNKVFSFLNNGTLVWSYTTGGPVGKVAISGNGQFVTAGTLAGIIYEFNNLEPPQPAGGDGTVSQVTGIVRHSPLPLIAGTVILLIIAGGAGAFYFMGARKRKLQKEIPGSDISRPGVVRPPEKIPAEWWEGQIPPGSDIRVSTMDCILEIAREISREGREGKQIGTAFLVGDAENVMSKSRQLIKNPVEGHSPEERAIASPDQKGYIKEMAQLDGAFVISGDGLIEAVGRRITVDTGDVHLPDGYGTRHASVAGMTLATKSIGIVVSQSGGKIAIFRNGAIIRTLEP